MKRFTIFTILMAAAFAVLAQTANQPGWKELQNGNYSKAEKKAEKAYKEDSTDAMNCYMLGLVFGEPKNPHRNNERAYSALQRTKSLIEDLNNLQRGLLKRDGLTIDTIEKLLNVMTIQGLDDARKINTKKAYDHFYDFYAATVTDSLRSAARDGVCAIDFAAAQAENSVEGYEHFLSMHPESKEAFTAEQRMHALAYQRAKNLNTLNAYERFLADYPDADEADDAELQIYTITYYRALSANTVEAFRKYAADYPDSPYASAAKRKVSALCFDKETDVSDWQSFKRYIDNHPNDIERIADAKRIIAEISIEDKNADGLEWSLHNGDSSMCDTVVRAIHDIYVNSDRIAEFDATYGQIVPFDLLKKDQTAMDAILAVNTSDRASVANALRATAPYRISYDMLLYMIELDAGRQKWEYVNKTVEQFADQFENNADYKALCATLAAPEVKLNKTFLSENINSKSGDEYSPVFSSDEQVLFFAGVNRSGNLGGADIFMSSMNSSGQWRRPFTVPGLNTVGHDESPVSISRDGQTIVIFKNEKLLFSQMTDEGWSMPKPLPEPLQIGSWQSDAMLTADGRSILFAARKKTEHEVASSINIYVSTLDENGNWSNPISLGPTINTFGNDRAPFLHPDMKTLYFCSNRHSNIGGLDVFKSTRLSEECWTEWSEPVNVGKEINTVGDDSWFIVNNAGTKAYMAAKNGESLDICVIDLPESMRPNKVATLTGKVTNQDGKPVKVQLRWFDLQTGALCGWFTTNPADGSFNIALPLGRNYGYFVADSSMFPASGTLDLRTTTISKKEHTTLTTACIAQLRNDSVAVELPLGSLSFNSSKAQLSPQSNAEIKRLAALIKRESLNVVLTVYTDEQSVSKNYSLDQQRVASVKDALEKEGCNAAKITTAVKTYENGRELSNRQHKHKSLMTVSFIW